MYGVPSGLLWDPAAAGEFDGAWIRQRHLEHGVSAAAVFLAAASQRTNRIELGTAVIPTYPRHPAVLAQQALTAALAVLCAEAVGVMDQALWISRDYMRTRNQFGVPIASFQVLQHRAADMYVGVEQARAAALRALAHLDSPPAERDRAVASAKAQVGKCGHFVCGQAIQVHGGIGLTTDLPVERLWRDQRSHMITEGTPEIMRMALARHVLNTFG